MSKDKFKVGDRIRRIEAARDYAPIGYEAVVLEGNHFLDAHGETTGIVSLFWERSYNKPRHCHSTAIIAWAYGADIEYLSVLDEWQDATSPSWGVDMTYRIKEDKVCPKKLEISRIEKEMTKLAEDLGKLKEQGDDSI